MGREKLKRKEEECLQPAKTAAIPKTLIPDFLKENSRNPELVRLKVFSE